MTLIEELRNKVSRDNRELLDRAAAEIEDLDRNLVAAYKKIEEMEKQLERAFVPPCKVGDVVYEVLDDPMAEGGWYFSADKVTEVGTRGLWRSMYSPAQDDMDNFLPWDEIGVKAFFTEEEVLAEVKRRRASSNERN